MVVAWAIGASSIEGVGLRRGLRLLLLLLVRLVLPLPAFALLPLPLVLLLLLRLRMECRDTKAALEANGVLASCSGEDMEWLPGAEALAEPASSEPLRLAAWMPSSARAENPLARSSKDMS